jgi:hypothetical protein
MATLWDDVKKAIVEGYVLAADKAEEMTQIGKAKVEILRVNRKIARTLSELGGRVFDLFEGSEEAAVAEDKEVIAAVTEIKGLQTELQELEKEIEKIKAERETGTVESPKAIEADG